MILEMQKAGFTMNQIGSENTVKKCRKLIDITRQEIMGDHGLMVVAAFRYCLGRRTYIVSDCTSWLVKLWPTFPENVKTIIKRDLESAFVDDDEARLANDSYKPLGDDCDRAAWETVRRLWSEK